MAPADISALDKHREPIDLSGAHIPGTSLSNAELANSNFSRANLSKVNFEGSNLRESDFRNANLTMTNFAGADLTGADLSSADLTGANLAGATLAGADLFSANLSDAAMEGVDLSETKGLHWWKLLESRFDRETALPEYLVEDDLFKILEHAYRRRPWRKEFSGRIGDLLVELAEIKKSANGSIETRLMLNQAAEDLEEKDAGRQDE